MATEQETQARLEALEPRVRRLAWRWSRDAPNAREDLEQVARVAVWEELRRQPDAPDRHLLAEAKDAISNERKRGSSVDGRLNPTTRRKRRYFTDSMDAPGPRDLPPISEALASGPVHAHDLWESPVEGEALGRVLYQTLRELLTPREDTLLTLLLLGYLHKEAGAMLRLTKQQVHRTHQAIQRKAVVLLGLDGQRPPSSARQRAARTAAVARWARRDPFVAPDTVQALLAWLMEPWND